MAAKRKAPKKRAAKRKTTDAAQHKRFLEAAQAVEASDDPQVFERAFKKVTRPKRSSD